MNRLSKYSNLLIMKQFKFVIITFLLIVCVVPAAQNVAAVIDDIFTGKVYSVVLDGVEVGYVNDLESAETMLENAKTRTMNILDKYLVIEASLQFYARPDEVVVASDDLEDKMVKVLLGNADQYLQSAYMLKVNDFQVVLSSRDEIATVLDKVRALYVEDDTFKIEIDHKVERLGQPLAPSFVKLDRVINKTNIVTASQAGDAVMRTMSADTIDKDGSPIVAVEFDEDIQIYEVFSPADEVVDVDEAFALVTNEKAADIIYEVKSGDCLSIIAEKNKTTMKAIMNNNPGLTETSILDIGEELVITTPEPELSVLSRERTISTQAYKAPVEYVENANEYKGTKKVLKAGVDGTKEVVAILSKRNGIEIESEVVSEEILQEAVSEVVEIGTKALPPKSPTGTFMKPISGGRFTSGFGYRWGSFHEGVDFATPVGTPIVAADGGKVTYSGWRSGYGYLIIISHGNGVETRYGHNSKLLVSTGTQVAKGERIALSGNTGRSTGPHLHFEVRVNGVAKNPLNYIRK